MKSKSPETKRYAAKLFFQFRVIVPGEQSKQRTCEERIIVMNAATAQAALAHAKRKGKEGQHSYVNSDGNRVRFEFIGVMEMIDLGSECGDDEVWYEIKSRMEPSERKNRFIPPESELRAIRNELVIRN